jgi:hypothetical protein
MCLFGLALPAKNESSLQVAILYGILSLFSSISALNIFFSDCLFD